MSTAISVYHGRFGRATLYQLNRKMTTHAHREGHLVFLVSGQSGGMQVCDKIRKVGPGRAAAVSPWEPHDFRPGNIEDGALFLILYVDPLWFLENGRSATSALRFGRSQIEVTPRIERSVHRVAAMLLDSAAPARFDAPLFELTRDCFDQSWQWTSGGHAFAHAEPRLSDFRVRKSIRLMTEKIGGEIELDDVARESGLSRPHFYKLFRKQTGITPNLYLNTLRMERAIERLTDTSVSVTDIAYDLGFASQSSFTRFFALNVGMAPTDYRRVAHRLPTEEAANTAAI